MQYINIWTSSDPDTQETVESYVADTVEQAAAAYEDNTGYRTPIFTYKHTLEFDLGAGTCRAIDVSKLNDEDDDDLPYEPLTGHELGVCPGRV